MGSTTGRNVLQVQDLMDNNSDRRKNMIQSIETTKGMSIDIMNELHKQGETIERIDDNLNRIHGNMDQAERHIREMEGIKGRIKNKLESNVNINGNASRIIDDDERKFQQSIVREKIRMVIPCLKKLKGGSLIPADLIFRNNVFSFCCEEGGKEKNGKINYTRNNTFYYDDVEKIVIRPRPLHGRIIFNNDSRRI